MTDQPVEAKIWLLGSGEGIKRVLAEANLGKEVTVSLFQRSANILAMRKDEISAHLVLPSVIMMIMSVTKIIHNNVPEQFFTFLWRSKKVNWDFYFLHFKELGTKFNIRFVFQETSVFLTR